ncbi:uncharacterized protein PG986_010323 [Apiospora aurea]|uniref:Uncharacterized protein n=1 Tax=Apiospora aurea TaxID=335848 RepID=A0ABR1Q1Z1_9PEZI
MPHETHGFGRMARDYAPANPHRAWPDAMPAATSWINHVPTRMDGTGDTAKVRRQAEKRWTFS